MEPEKLARKNQEAYRDGPTIRRVNEDGSVTVLREESQDASGAKAAARSNVIRALDYAAAEEARAEIEDDEADAAAEAADSESKDLGDGGQIETIDLGELYDDPLDLGRY